MKKMFITILFFCHFMLQSQNTFPLTGNVGIGTNNPSAKLDITTSGDGAEILRFSTERPWVFKQQGTGPSSNLVLQELSGNKYFKIRSNDYTDVYWIESSTGNSYFKGKVGIGTTTPDSKLSVKGKIHAEEIKVDLSVPAPDYVFKEDYDLRTLEETQKYIDENGHLPNIPSAKELEANGVELGVMNMKLLEKIEELTLYILQLEKENKKMMEFEERLKSVENKLK